MERSQTVTAESARALGLLPQEYEKIQLILNRKPNFTELALFSAMWSEHCSYKNSVAWLKKLPKEGARILAEAGQENAGLVDIGDGLACAFKIESHNHPSAIAPFDGAATGVGGVNRDIFTMGARPVAQLNSLHVGELSDPAARTVLAGAVKGMAFYGGGLKTPTVAGELHVDESYQRNPLVNAMSVGIMNVKDVIYSAARGEGNLVFLVGALTGKDGVHGASSASKEISEDSADDFSSVPKGNPDLQRALMEAALEASSAGLIVGMQDMGAAGLICSAAEMSAKGEVGMRIELDRVNLREKQMEPFQILLSESQERMLVIVEPGNEAAFKEVFKKWQVNCDSIGEVIGGGRLEFYKDAERVAEVSAHDLVLGGGAPVYDRPYTAPEKAAGQNDFSLQDLPLPEDLRNVAQFLIGHVNLGSRQWIFKQFEDQERERSPRGDSAVIPVGDGDKGLALTVSSAARYLQADPRTGTCISIAQAARNIVCAGGEPLAITNCLNFGNPYDPEVYWQFKETIIGMKEACTVFSTPVTGGNVSFYNQASESEAIMPTPVIGMIGLVPCYNRRMTGQFKQKDDFIYLLGNVKEDVGSSVYLDSYHKIKNSPAPYFNMEEELELQAALAALIQQQLIVSAHSVAKGGLYLSLLECAIPNRVGFAIATDPSIRKDAFLFGESQGRVVISVNGEKRAALEEYMASLTVPCLYLGVVTNSGNVVDDEMYDTTAHAKTVYDVVLDRYFTDVQGG